MTRSSLDKPHGPPRLVESVGFGFVPVVQAQRGHDQVARVLPGRAGVQALQALADVYLEEVWLDEWDKRQRAGA